MSYAVLMVRDFALHAWLRLEPTLAGRPVALTVGEGRKAMVSAVVGTTEVAPGLPVALAMARCPGLVLKIRNPAAEVEAGRLLYAAAFALSPRVEATGGGMCTIDLQGVYLDRIESSLRQRLQELDRAGLPAQAGVADTPLLARYAAERAAPLLWVREAKGFLRDLPLAVADPVEVQQEILHGWGIKTCGQLTALAKAEVAERLGTDGVRLWERAAGETTRPLRLIDPPKTFVAAWSYEPPIDTLEPLSFKLRRYAELIAMELRGAGLVAEALVLTLLLEDESDHRKEFTLPRPGADPETWTRVMHVYLESLQLPSRLVGARLGARPTRPERRQQGLFETGLTDAAAFWENLARITALLGGDRVGTPVRADTHEPDRFALEKPAEIIPPPVPPSLHPMRGLTLRRFRPGWPVRVNLVEARPAWLAGELTGRIEAARGPWRLEGNWWGPEAWAVETWQIEIGRVAYELACTREGWRVVGVYD